MCLFVLMLFAMAKIVTVLAEWSGLLHNSNFSGQVAMFCIGIAELAAVSIMVFVLSIKQSCELIALIGATFLVYRFVINPTTCPCMGAAPDLLPWLKVNAQVVLVTIPCWWLWLGLWGWAREIKTND